MPYSIREIQPQDNARVEEVIRTCLIEFGGNHAGLAWSDPDLGRFSEVYAREGRRYWVVLNQNGIVTGGAGIGELPGVPGVCELQKMYCMPEARGTGIAHKLMALALDYATAHYERCYIETLSNMDAANRFYQHYGFQKLKAPLVATEHYACDVWYLKELRQPLAEKSCSR